MNKKIPLLNTPKRRMRYGWVSPEQISLVIKKHSLDKIFKKYNIPIDRREEICRLLIWTTYERTIEIRKIAGKAHYRPIEKIRLLKLYDDVEKLLSTTPYFKDEEKEQCKNIIKFAVTIGEGNQERLGELKKITQKRTVGKIKQSEKNLHIYTLLISELVYKINAVFQRGRNKKMELYPGQDKKKSKNVILTQTNVCIAKLINAAFPNLKFTPEQVKGRYHKE